MAWADGTTTGQGSTRATSAARTHCLNHARHRCQIQHPGCTGTATEAHHPDGLADTGRRRQDALDTHRLIATCTHCHRIETREQSRRGLNRWKRKPEPHPGLLPTR